MKTRIEELEEEIKRYSEILDRSYGRWSGGSSYMENGVWKKSGKEYLDDLKAELKELRNE